MTNKTRMKIAFIFLVAMVAKVAILITFILRTRR